MSLTTSQRFGAYFIGFSLGCVIVTIYLSKRGLPPPPVARDPGVIRREVPGVLAQWVHSGTPIEGNFIVSESKGPPGENGLISRWVVVPGLDQGSFIRVEEQSPSVDLGKILNWKFMFADRVRVRLQPQADTKALADAMAPLGWHFLAREKDADSLAIQLNSHEADAVTKAVAQLQGWPQWVVSAEPDFLPAPTGTGVPNL